MDLFGIGNAMIGAARIYFQSARKSGRTLSMVKAAKTGDRIVFTNMAEANRVKMMCEERGINVECIAVPIDKPNRLFEIGTASGRVILDHTWVENYYLASLDHAKRKIDHFQQATSASSWPRLEKRHEAIEKVKWQIFD